MKFGDLKTGDVMTLAGQTSVILAIEKPHPLRPGFWLFVWWIFDDNRVSFDMLSPAYDLIPGTGIHQDGLVSWKRARDEIEARN